MRKGLLISFVLVISLFPKLALAVGSQSKSLKQLIYEEPIGFASVETGTTGGRGGRIVSTSDINEFQTYAASSEPLVILVTGVLNFPWSQTRISSNKTIIGMNANAKVTGGGFAIKNGANNIIIRNLIFEKCSPDAIGIEYYSHHIWIDHCDFSSDGNHVSAIYDGLLDIRRGSDYVTVSWNKFHDHKKVSLVGDGDDNGGYDIGHLKVTYHHNWFYNSNQRHPSLRFGTGHIYNNYYNNFNDHAINSRCSAEVVAESNYFEHAGTAFITASCDGRQGKLTNRNNIFIETAVGVKLPVSSFDPTSAYSYSLDRKEDVKTIVKEGAGTVAVTGGSCPLKVNGDANCDGIISIVDFGIWRNEYFGLLSTKNTDFDNTGSVGIVDFEIWRRGFLEG